MAANSWTEERVELLKKMWEEGLSTPEIGERLDITKNAVVGKVHRLKLQKRQDSSKSKNKGKRRAKSDTKLKDKSVSSKLKKGESTHNTKLKRSKSKGDNAGDERTVRENNRTKSKAKELLDNKLAKNSEEFENNLFSLDAQIANSTFSGENSFLNTKNVPVYDSSYSVKELEQKLSEIMVIKTKVSKGQMQLETLKNSQCHWPIGDPNDKKFYFCAKAADSATPYCLEHSKMAYVKASKK